MHEVDRISLTRAVTMLAETLGRPQSDIRFDHETREFVVSEHEFSDILVDTEAARERAVAYAARHGGTGEWKTSVGHGLSRYELDLLVGMRLAQCRTVTRQTSFAPQPVTVYEWKLL